MNTKDGSKKCKILILFFSVLSLSISCYAEFYNYIHNHLSIEMDNDKIIEYGSKEYDLSKFINKNNGDILSVSDVINTNIIGEQYFFVKVGKYFISKTIPVSVEIVDTQGPTIVLKEDEVIINKGQKYNLLDNILSITDNVDNMIYSNIIIGIGNVAYYTLNSNFDNFKSGLYNVEVVAFDKSNNISTAEFKINVKDK